MKKENKERIGSVMGKADSLMVICYWDMRASFLFRSPLLFFLRSKCRKGRMTWEGKTYVKP